jgi:hypothetical protein
MPGSTRKAGDILRQLQATARASSNTDMMRFAIIEAYKSLRQHAWTWNWRNESTVTVAPFEEAAGIVHSWTEGTTIVHSATVATLTSDVVTGCMVQLGSEWYKIIDYNFSSATAFIVDRPILGNGTDVRLSFTRPTYGFRGGKTRNVQINAYKAISFNESFMAEQFYWRQWRTPSVSRVYCLSEAQENLPPAPKYPLEVAQTSPGAFPAGRYLYFATRYDPVSKLESSPGPITEYLSDGTKDNPLVAYENAISDRSDYTSYDFRFYRTQVNPPDSVIPPFFLIGSRGPRKPTSTFQDLFTTTLREEQYYDGKQQALLLMPPPNAVQSLRVELIDTYGYRFWEDENIPIGENDAVMEILGLTASLVVAGSTSMDVATQLAMKQKIRAQIQYLLTQNRCDSDLDYGYDNFVPNRPGAKSNYPMDLESQLNTLPWNKDW